MEYLEGKALNDMMADFGPLGRPEALHIAIGIARALEAAHTAGIVHRDIKPANVFITKDNHVKVMDFGIARTEDSELTRTGMVLGSPSYMSPEQDMGKKLDGRSDLFSLGIIIYQMLSGEKPFEGNNYHVISHRKLREKPKR